MPRDVRGACKIVVGWQSIVKVENLDLAHTRHSMWVNLGQMFDPLIGVVILNQGRCLKAKHISRRIKASCAGRDFLPYSVPATFGARSSFRLMSKGAIVEWNDVMLKSELPALPSSLKQDRIFGVIDKAL